MGTRDHCNSRGERLVQAAHIVRQDRANVYRGVVDAEDEADALFADRGEREHLAASLVLSPDTEAAIRDRTPLIALLRERGAYRVEILEPGEWARSCP